MKSYQFSTLRLAITVFGNARKARSWMSRSQKLFCDKSALEVMETAEECERVREFLNRIDHGLIS
ncbi:MbcA/ParS/Xre antitoxin family protein [Limnobacter sp.]|uniref:MbcA/ParS/Xre antitoxin family protein n=1 Tax=Limnobacter sp. TaxID=2003368 RepID=UPI00359C2388